MLQLNFSACLNRMQITGWRLGWMCGNAEVISRFAKAKSTIDNGIFKALQKACAYIMNSPEGEDYIAQRKWPLIAVNKQLW